jgi:hypothetical protein
MDAISVRIGDEDFSAVFQNGLAPATCRWFQSLLPWRQTLIQARWSGEACWIPLGDAKVEVGLEEAITSPLPGQFLFYPGGKSETEILLPYGPTNFCSEAGQLAGNPFLKITDGLERLEKIGRDTWWKGAQTITFDS